MSTLTLNNSRRGILTAILLIAMVMWTAPATYADDTGHTGSKPPNADGDGIPNNADPDFAYGSRNGEQNVNGDGSQGTDPASEGGDGIPNGGPIEGEGHSGKGGSDTTSIFAFFSQLFSL